MTRPRTKYWKVREILRDAGQQGLSWKEVHEKSGFAKGTITTNLDLLVKERDAKRETRYAHGKATDVFVFVSGPHWTERHRSKTKDDSETKTHVLLDGQSHEVSRIVERAVKTRQEQPRRTNLPIPATRIDPDWVNKKTRYGSYGKDGLPHQMTQLDTAYIEYLKAGETKEAAQAFLETYKRIRNGT